MTGTQIKEKIPKTGVVFALVTGGFFLLFGMSQLLIGLSSKPIDWTGAAMGLREAVWVGLGMILIALLQWGRPKLGSLVLILAGTGYGIWVIQDWSIPSGMGLWLTRLLLCVFPITIGVISLISEYIKSDSVSDGGTS